MPLPHELFGDVLPRPQNALYYELSREIRRAFPDRWILETEDYDFDVRSFAREGHCELRPAEGFHTYSLTEWSAYQGKIGKQVQDGWFKVQWEGQEMLYATTGIYTRSCRESRVYLIAPNESVANSFFETVCRWSNEIRGEVLVFSHGYWQKSEELYESIKGTTLENLVLPSTLKDEVRENVRGFFEAEETYRRHNLPWKRGLLFLGPPGNGKTHMIKGLANELSVPCLYVRGFSSRQGTPHENIGRAFQRARESAPCLFILEDLDALVDDRNRSYFLNEMDGFYSNRGILTVATTNHPDRLDPAILDRPSRFDRKFNFTLPATPERLRYLQVQNQGLEESLRMSEEGLHRVAEQTEGFSFAYLKELILSAMMAWIREETRRPMEEIVLTQVDSLASQMRTEWQTPSRSPRTEEDEEDEDED